MAPRRRQPTAMVADVGKMAVLVTALVIAGVVLVLGIIRTDTAATLIGSNLVTAVVLYVTGNGVLARNGQAPSPVLVARPDRVQADADAIHQAVAAVLRPAIEQMTAAATPPPLPASFTPYPDGGSPR
jgi:hypothetical protein